MDLHPGEQIVFEGRPVWRSILSFYISGLIGAVIIGVGSPHEVVDAVDRAQREASAAGHARPDGL